MKIGRILDLQQPEVHEQLNQICKENNKTSKNKEHLSTRDIQELMSHSCYKRSKGGAFKQIK